MVPLSPSGTEGDEESGMPERKRDPRCKSRGKGPQCVSSPNRARELERIPPIHEDDFEDIGDYPFEEPQDATARIRQSDDIPFVKEFVLGGKTLEE